MKTTMTAVAALAAAAMMIRAPGDPPPEGMRGQPPPAMGERLASFTGSSYDAATRTCEVVMATGYVVRRSWYTEELEISDAAIDLARVALNQVRFLFNHNSDEPIGVVEFAEVRPGAVVGRVKFAETPEGDKYAGMVQRGELTGVSVGYQVHQWTRVSSDDANMDEWRATRWELLELSLVPVPADPLAGIRSAATALQPLTPPTGVAGVSQEEDEMRRHLTVAITAALAEHTRSAPAGQNPAVATIAAAVGTALEAHVRANPTVAHTPLTPVEIETAVSDILASRSSTAQAQAMQTAIDAGIAQGLAARAVDTTVIAPVVEAPASLGGLSVVQVLQLRGQAVGYGLPEDVTDEILGRSGITRPLAVEAIMDAVATRQQAGTSAVPAGAAGRVLVDERSTNREAMQEALLHRYRPGEHPMTDRARQFVGMSLLDMGREALGWSGESTRGMDRNQIAQRALSSTSDFPLILGQVTNTTLRRAYETKPRTFMPLCRRTTLSDFKEAHRVKMSEAPQLLEIGENGEYERGAMTESEETIKLKSYGRIIGVTRQVIINDDLGAFTRIPQLWGQAVATLESDIVWSLIVKNAKLKSDGLALFHATHKNLKSTGGAAPSIDTVSDGRVTMAHQTGMDGKTLLNVEPKFIVVPTELLTAVEQLTATLTPADLTKAVPDSFKKLIPISDPRLSLGINGVGGSATAWYLFADPESIDTLEYGYLEGQEGPYLESRNGFDVDGVEFKCRHDFGAAPADYVGVYKNSGVA